MGRDMIEPHNEREAAVDDLSDALLLHGVYEGFPEKRGPLAADLVAHGWTPADVALMARATSSAERPTAALAEALRDRGRAEERLSDLRRAADLRKQAQKAEPGVAERKTGPMTSGLTQSWDRIDRRRAVRAFLRDGKPEADVAEWTGASLSEVKEVAAELAAERPSPRAPEPRETHRERVERFRREHGSK